MVKIESKVWNKHYELKDFCNFVSPMGPVHLLQKKFYYFMEAHVLPWKHGTVQSQKDASQKTCTSVYQ
jgi:hypothetical protein